MGKSIRIAELSLRGGEADEAMTTVIALLLLAMTMITELNYVI